jgi:hypothetical protein
MTTSQSERAKRFRALHEQPGAFVIRSGPEDFLAEF